MKNLTLALVIFLFGASTSFAASETFNFSFSSPPVPMIQVPSGSNVLQIGAGYLSMREHDASPGTGVDLKGGGVDLILGKQLSDTTGLYWHTTAADLTGKTTVYDSHMVWVDFRGYGIIGGTRSNDTNLFLNTHDLTFALEPIKANFLRPVLFAGPTLTWGVSSNSSLEAGLTQEHSTDWIFLYGVQAGAGVGIRFGEAEVTPLLLVKEQWGTQITSGHSTYLPGFLQIGYGLEAAYRPWGLVLSGMMSESEGSGSSSGVRSAIYLLSWNHSW